MRTGELTFLSNRATAQVSIAVAGIFGTYSLLFAMEKLNFYFFLVAYVALVAIDVISCLNFGYYAHLAQQALFRLMGDEREKYLDESSKTLATASLPVKIIDRFRHNDTVKTITLYSLWFLAVVMPFIGVLIKVYWP